MKTITLPGIELKEVPERSRMTFLPRYFPRDYIRAENQLYNIADLMLVGYTGGYWAFAVLKLDDGSRFPVFVLKSEHNRQKISNPLSGEEVEVDDILAGIIVTIYTGQYLDNDNGYTIADQLTRFAYDYAKLTGQSQQAFDMLD